jgi:hypothetical protein
MSATTATPALPPDAEYVITTLSRTVHEGRTPHEPLTRSRGR